VSGFGFMDETVIDGPLYDAWTGPRIIKGIEYHGILDATFFSS
jgi:hypothetical protein